MSEESTPKRGFCIPVRYIILCLAVLACLCEYVTRVNLNIAIVSMVKTDSNNTKNTLVSLSCDFPEEPIKAATNTSTPDEKADNRYEWSPSTQGIILGSFFYGYVVLQIPGGRLAELFGGKWVVAAGIFVSGLINLITPFVVESVVLFTATRVVLGLVQGVVFPACFAILYEWMPIKERSVSFSMLSCGGNIGSIIATSMTGYLSDHGFAGGWPSTFYISGIMSMVWCVFWALFVKSSPGAHSMFSSQEMEYIKQNTDESEDDLVNQNPPIPWKSLLTSKPVVAVIFTKFCGNWGYTTLQTKLPAYLHDILHIPDTKNGLLNSLLYIAICVSLTSGGYISELIISKGYLTRSRCRKVFESIALLGCGFCLALVPLMGCNQPLVILLLVTGMLLYGNISGGDVPIVVEMTSNFPATVFALANMVSVSAGIVAPYVIGLIIESAKTGDELKTCWSYVFFMAAIIDVLGAVAFVSFSSATLQPWDSCHRESAEEEIVARYTKKERVFSASIASRSSRRRCTSFVSLGKM